MESFKDFLHLLFSWINFTFRIHSSNFTLNAPKLHLKMTMILIFWGKFCFQVWLLNKLLDACSK